MNLLHSLLRSILKTKLLKTIIHDNSVFHPNERNVAFLDDGSEVLLSELLQRVPQSIYLTRSHLEISERLAGKKFSDPDLNKLYVNLVFQKSEKARQLSALAALISAGKIKVLRIKSNFITPDFCAFFGDGPMIEFSGNRNSNLLGKTLCIKYVVKIFLNILYRVFRNKNLSSTEIVVRAWNSGSEKIFKDVFSEALVLLYPVYPPRLRQTLKFYLHCFSNYKRVSFYGLPYRFGDAIRVVANCRTLDETLVQIEYTAQLRHAKEIIHLAPRLFLTSDQELGAGSFVLHHYLSFLNCKTICRSHGVWADCPYIFYDEYHIISASQLEFFSLRNHDVHFILKTFYEMQEKSGLPISQMPTKLSPIVVFIHQGFGYYNRLSRREFVYEADFEKKAICLATKFCERMGIEFRIKPHPFHCSGKEIKDFPVETIYSMEELHGMHPIFLNIHSSAFFDFRCFGPTIFLGDEIFHCLFLSGLRGLVNWVELKQLEKAIQKLLCPSEWYKAYLQQIAC